MVFAREDRTGNGSETRPGINCNLKRARGRLIISRSAVFDVNPRRVLTNDDSGAF